MENNYTGPKIGYIRVSTEGQNLARQQSTMDDQGVSKVFVDKETGRTQERSGLREAIEWLREGDTLVVESTDRLGRIHLPTLNTIHEITEVKGAAIHFVADNLYLTKDESPIGARIQLNMLMLIRENELKELEARRASGVKAAAARGVYSQPRKHKVSDDLALKALASVDSGVAKAVVARELGINRGTLYAVLERARGLRG